MPVTMTMRRTFRIMLSMTVKTRWKEYDKRWRGRSKRQISFSRGKYTAKLKKTNNQSTSSKAEVTILSSSIIILMAS